MNKPASKLYCLGTTNFHDVLKDIDKILEMIQTNVETDFGNGLIKLSSSLDKISSTSLDKEY